MSGMIGNEEARVGRMFNAMLDPGNEKGRVTITVAVEDADGRRRLHETFDLKRWQSKDGAAQKLFVSVPGTADWEAGVRPLTPISVDLLTGEMREGKDERVTPLLAFAARKALDYARTGTQPNPGNGQIACVESDECGACGRKLTDHDSIERGIGPECWKRMTGARPRRTTQGTIHNYEQRKAS
jgi:hypothetical protein